MHKTYAYFQYDKALLHYSVTGKGKKILLAFHGFGQTGDDFRELEEVISDEFTIYSFDLFYHGKSFWHEREIPLSKAFWKEMVLKFLEEKSIDSFSLLGFSMGGKFVLATLESFPDRTETVYLISPDGINLNFWYKLATSYSFTRKLLRSFVAGPAYYNFIVNTVSKLKLVNKGVLKFTESQMRTRAQRRRVYYSWVIFRELRFDQKKIADLINSHNIEFKLYLGKHDKMITYKRVKSFLKMLRHYDLKILDTGHTRILNWVTQLFKQKLEIRNSKF
ncbi:MAG: alpha/beta hydrolase [Cytophagaceae bacterium]